MKKKNKIKRNKTNNYNQMNKINFLKIKIII